MTLHSRESKVRRYKRAWSFSDGVGMKEDESGDYVLYSDYEALKKREAELKSTLEQLARVAEIVVNSKDINSGELSDLLIWVDMAKAALKDAGKDAR